MLNSVSLVGRLTKDVDLRYTTSGKAVGQFTLAVNGYKEDDASFISCVVWEKKAESTANYVKKGNLVGVNGMLKTRTYDGKDGNTVFVTEVIVNEIHFLEPKKVETQMNEPQFQQNSYRQNR